MEDVRITEVFVPGAGPGRVPVRVKMFGINHSESLLRLEEIDSEGITYPVILGIECIGEVADPSDSGLKAG